MRFVCTAASTFLINHMASQIRTDILDKHFFVLLFVCSYCCFFTTSRDFFLSLLLNEGLSYTENCSRRLLQLIGQACWDLNEERMLKPYKNYFWIMVTTADFLRVYIVVYGIFKLSQIFHGSMENVLIFNSDIRQAAFGAV